MFAKADGDTLESSSVVSGLGWSLNILPAALKGNKVHGFRPLLVLLTLSLSPWCQALLLDLNSASGADRAGKSRFGRILTGRNEALRSRQLALLSEDVAARIAALDDLLFALDHFAGVADEGKDVPASVGDLVDVIVKVNRPQAKQAVIALLDSPHLKLAMIAADRLGHNQVYEAIEPLKSQVDREDYASHYGYRFNLVRALVQMKHPDAIEFLGELERKLDGQLRHELGEILSEIDVNDFRGDEARFGKFKSAGESIFKKASFPAESKERIQFQRNQYYGIDINAKRLLFILDHSGSMNEAAASGTRLVSAKRELMSAINGLPEDAEFGILLFSEAIRAWKSDLVMATEKNKQAAFQFISRIQASKKTNTYGALRRAMNYNPQLEAVFLLTDGKPTMGQIISPAGIVNDIMRRNEMRHLTINTVGIALEETTEVFMRTLAERSNGEFRMPH